MTRRFDPSNVNWSELAEQVQQGARSALQTAQKGGDQIQRLGKRFGLGALIAFMPLLETDQAAQADQEIVDEGSDREDAVFLRHLQAAKARLHAKLDSGSSLKPLQKAVLEKALAYPEEELMAVAIKESRLNAKAANGGYLQLTGAGVADLEDLFPNEKFGVGLPPEKNVEQGLLYLAMLEARYVAPHELAKEMSDEDRRELGRFFYNMGPTAGRRIWEATEATSIDEFEDGLLEMLGDKMSWLNYFGVDLVGPQSSTWVKDENYGVEYDRSEAEAIYLKHSAGKKERKEDSLEQPLFEGTNYPTVEKAIISLRYLHLTHAMAEELKDPSERKDYLDQMFGKEEPKSIVMTKHAVKKGDTLWELSGITGVSVAYLKALNGLSSDALVLGQTLKIPVPGPKVKPYLYFTKIGSQPRPWIAATSKGFYSTLVENEDYREYLKEEADIPQGDIEEVVFEFNKAYNPEFAKVGKVTEIPSGAWIWVPNVDYFIDYFKDSVGKPKDPDQDREGAPEEKAAPKYVPSGPLNKTDAGQYVTKVGGKWKLDPQETAEGALSFPVQTWEQHPKWTVAGDLKRKRFGGSDGLQEVRYVILHSTISGDSAATRKRELAHYAVERDGTIPYIVSVNKDGDSKFQIPPHAGKSCWDGTQDLNRFAIGIEVVANAKQEWSTAQYDSVERLVEWIGGYYGLEQNDVLLHKQIAADGHYGRGRKSDPYAPSATQFWANLDLPNNSALLDLCVARGSTEANVSAINADKNHTDAWPGLEAAHRNF